MIKTVPDYNKANGCMLLAEVCADIVRTDPDITPHQFLQVMGMTVAGIEPGLAEVFDLATGGSKVRPATLPE